MRELYLDCFSGASGDMIVGALVDLGVPPSLLEWELSKVAIGDCHLHFDKRSRNGIEGVKFTVHEGAVHRPEQNEPDRHSHGDHGEAPHHHHDHSHHHSGDVECAHHHDEPHSHPHHAHPHGRSFAEIRSLIETSHLSAFVKERSIAVFHRVAVAEGKIHGQAPETVTFHEVGALDSIADIISACAAIEHLQVDRVTASRLVEGSGFVTCAHGRFPVPAPATLEILRGIELAQEDDPGERITPTGAALLAEFVAAFGPMPEMRVEKVGYGIGTRQHPSRPNVLRAILGEGALGRDQATKDQIALLETTLDDTSPEVLGYAMERLFAEGALDVYFTPVQMKKQRPGVVLTVLCALSNRDRLAAIVLRETGSFGLRIETRERMKLERKIFHVQTPYGEVAIKAGWLDGKAIIQSPEYESCSAIARSSGRSVREIHAAALAATQAQA